MPKPISNQLVPTALISRKIYFFRGTRVMLDSDLAQLYGVNTSRLNEAVLRKHNRFPKDFMFQLTRNELQVLRSQTAISNPPVEVAVAFSLTRSLNMVWRCSQASCIAIEPCRSTSQLCGHSYNSVACSPPTKTCGASLRRWKNDTIRNSTPFSRRFGRCWRPRSRPNGRSDSTPEPDPFELKTRFLA